MQAAFFVISSFILAITTSGKYSAKGIIIDRPSGQYMIDGATVDGIRLKTSEVNLDDDDDSFECDEFDAVDQGGTSSVHRCKCTNKASTFSYFNGEWKCVENDEFRQREGKCKKFLSSCVHFFIKIN